jgi:ectoine hydroxylase-related dioxygenase (phytanoyl-CoA dioxygenase family)
MFQDVKPLSEADVEQHVANIARDGFTILRDAVPVEAQRAMLDELDRLESVRPGGDSPKGDFVGHVTRRWHDLLNDADLWQNVPVHPWLMQVLPHVLGDGFLLSSMSTVVIGPGEPAQGIHVDDAIYGFARPHPEIACNTMWALTDFTEEIGATRVVPGSNNLPADPTYGEAYQSIPLEMPAGSIGIIVGGCYHGGGANKTNRDRPAIAVNYCRGVMRQQENIMLAIHPERMMTFPRELQDIIGFKYGRMAGYIHGTDPRAEMERRYPKANADSPYLAIRNELHEERLKTENKYI